MTEQAIMRVLPQPFAAGLTDDDIVELYANPSGSGVWARVNFVSSLDGSATHDGRSAGLSDGADRRVFDLLRTLCDVVVVGAGTVRTEGYGPMRVDASAVRRREAAGLASQPVFALVSAALDLDPTSSIFTAAPVRPIIVTGAAAPADRKKALEQVADVLVCGEARVDTSRMLRELGSRGLSRVHCEGGPHLFGAMVADGAVDELCLTLSAQLEGGSGRRITDGAFPPAPLSMRLAHVLASDDTLLLRYVRA
jgi:riboflavin biosynthesis pyrimidine reductase